MSSNVMAIFAMSGGNIMAKARAYREYGPYDRFKSKRVGTLYRRARYPPLAARSRSSLRHVPLLAYQTREYRDCVFI